jgi:chromosome segregation ATPase
MQKTMQDLDDAIQKYGISATDLANKLQQARQAQQQFNDAAKQQAQADVSGLIGMKGQQTTLNELKNYANELKRTMANLDPKSQEWKKLNDIYKQTNREIKNIQNSMKDVQKQSRSLMDISGQLARRLALVFSVSQITGYVKKLIEVRGEFELQQRSLQAILQNKDEANRIWQQTVDLAVRSPFRVKELVSYTKQLAAYRIESDKLFETNKMLADISAGLGVDMQRLILAFGQVRSAAYLRGTELRQFTEA